MEEPQDKPPPPHCCPCCKLAFNDLIVYVKHLRGMRTAVDRALVLADKQLDAVKPVRQ